MKKLACISDRLWKFFASLSGVFLVAYTFLIIANIIMRRFFGSPIFGSTELVRYGALVSGALALSQNEWFDGNIQMTLLLEKISARAKNIIEIIDYIICSCAFVYIDYLLLKQAMNKFAASEVTVDLRMSVGVFAVVLGIGFIVLTLCLIVKMILKCHQLATGENLCGKAAQAD